MTHCPFRKHKMLGELPGIHRIERHLEVFIFFFFKSTFPLSFTSHGFVFRTFGHPHTAKSWYLISWKSAWYFFDGINCWPFISEIWKCHWVPVATTSKFEMVELCRSFFFFSQMIKRENQNITRMTRVSGVSRRKRRS